MNGRTEDVKGAPSELAPAYHGSKVCLDGLGLRILAISMSISYGRAQSTAWRCAPGTLPN